ncbi:MAG: curli production assembly/transport protein CsgE [Gammaproteobacteria bacterium]|nr:curli production assembly/transport protein CsgE [Gammaproteobacteria bacterium]
MLVPWLMLLGVGSVCAMEVAGDMETNGVAEEAALEDEGIRGVIIDNTMTIIGRRFYDAFSIAWPDYGVGKDENFSIHEQPTARSGSRIWIEHNRQKLYQVFLSPVQANTRDTVRKAAKKVSERFEKMQLERALFINPDLAADEI